MIYNKSKHEGFSLVETLVSIAILLLVIVGPMSISATAARSTSFSSEQVIAFFLAQEGAELAQKARDDILVNHFLDISDLNYESNPWVTFINSTPNVGNYEKCFNGGCGLEIETNATGDIKTPISCSGNNFNNCKLYFDNNTNDRSRYTYTSASNVETPYTRIITFHATGNREVLVTSRVFWRTGSQRAIQEVVVNTYLFNTYVN